MSTFESRKKAASIRQKQIDEKGFRFTEEDGTPRFVADVMLGRLAKWLRIAGFDVLYSNTYSDDELVRISNSEGRILLSRDTRLLVRKEVRRFVFLESQELQEQIRQLFGGMHLEGLSSPLTRCISCNEALQDATRESVRALVPVFVYDTQERFKTCPSCGKIFWAGTHRASVVRILEKLGRNESS
jgi:uncharacterized protein